MKVLISIFLSLIFVPAIAQKRVWDVTKQEALISQNKKEYELHTDLKNNNNLKSAQQANLVNRALTRVKDVHKAIEQRLTNVKSLMTDVNLGFQSTQILTDILKYQKTSIALAANDPKLLQYVIKKQKDLIDKGYSLASFLTTYIITPSQLNKITVGERRILLMDMLKQLKILRGIAFNIYQLMRWHQKSRTTTLGDYTERDQKIIDNIRKDTKRIIGN